MTKKQRKICIGCETCSIKDNCIRLNNIVYTFEIIAKRGGTLLFFIGSFIFASSTSAGNTPYIFILFAIGHILWATVGLVMKDKSILFLNGMYLLFDISAILIRL